MTAEGLTEAEIDQIGRAMKKVAGVWPPTPALAAVERILADRLAAVQAERDQAEHFFRNATENVAKYHQRAESAEAERDALRERVEALAVTYARHGAEREAAGRPAWPNNVARDLRAALDADRSTDPSAGSERA